MSPRKTERGEFCARCDVARSLHPYPGEERPEEWECAAAEARASVVNRFWAGTR